MKVRNPDDTFNKTEFDGAGRSVRECLCYDTNEKNRDYSAAKTLTGDTVIEQIDSTYDKGGNVIFSVRFERYPSAQGTDHLTEATARAWYRAAWYDLLGRVEVSAEYGDNGGVQLAGRPSRPGASTSSVRTVRHKYGSNLNGGFRWSYTESSDNTISGQEIDSLGRVVLSWTKSATSDHFKVTTFTHDRLGHVVRKMAHQDFLSGSGFGFGDTPPHWTASELSEARPSTTEYVWGVKREAWGGEGDWSSNLISSTNLLSEVRPPDRSTENPVGSSSWRTRKAYDAFGEVRATWLDVTVPGESTVRIGRSLSYDKLGRKSEDRVMEGYNESEDPARILRWNYDPPGRLVSAETRDGSAEPQRASLLLAGIMPCMDAWRKGVKQRKRVDPIPLHGAAD